MRICISAGHAKDVRGAAYSPRPPYLEEVDEARKITKAFADLCNNNELAEVEYWWDDVSQSQSENLDRIVAWHNSSARFGGQAHDLDISVHLNANAPTSKPMGTEVLHYPSNTRTQALAAKVSAAISSTAGWPDRGPKPRGDLAVINGCEADTILLEVCFVDSSSDGTVYREKYDAIVRAIVESVIGQQIDDRPPVEPPERPERPPATEENRLVITAQAYGDMVINFNNTRLVAGDEPDNCPVVDITMAVPERAEDLVIVLNGQEFHGPFDDGVRPPSALFEAYGPCSWFGGPQDMGVAPDEGLAFIYNYNEAPHLFLDQQPPGTTGLARRLDTDSVYYVACRWDYDVTPKTMLADKSRKAIVRARGREFEAWPADWGPNENTGRVADLSRALVNALGIETDDPVEVIYPAG